MPTKFILSTSDSVSKEQLIVFVPPNNLNSDPQLVKIPATIQDIKDYTQAIRTASNLSYKLYAYFSPDLEIQAAKKSFNEFIKYRYLTSKILDQTIILPNNKYVADISYLDLSNEEMGLIDGNFDYIYAIGTNWNNQHIETCSFKHSIQALSKFNNSLILYSDFDNSDLTFANLLNAESVFCTSNQAITFGMQGDFKQEIGLIQTVTNKYNSFTRKVSENTQLIAHEATLFANQAISSISTIKDGVEGAVTLGLIARTASYLFMTVKSISNSYLIQGGANMWTIFGAIEGYKYYSNSPNSLILKLKNTLSHYNIRSKNDVKSHPYIDQEEILSNHSVSFNDDENQAGQHLSNLLHHYNNLPTLTFETIEVHGNLSDWQINEQYVPSVQIEEINDEEYAIIQNEDCKDYDNSTITQLMGVEAVQ